MKRYSNSFIGMMLLGIMCLICTICLMTIEQPSPSAAAVMATFSFIFLWAPNMLPDEEKYVDHSYKGNKRRQDETTGSN